MEYNFIVRYYGGLLPPNSKKITNLAFYFKVCENNFEFADFNLQFAKHDL